MGMFAGGPEAIKAGRLDASWELFPADLGKVAGQAVVAVHAGEEVEPVISTPMIFVTAENIAEVQAMTAAPAQASEPFVVGYSAAGLIDELQIAWSEGLTEVVEAAGGEVIIVDSQNDIAKQIADIEDLLAQEHRLSGDQPGGRSGHRAGDRSGQRRRACRSSPSTGHRAGGEVRVHVGFDNYKAGYDAGIYIAEQNGGQGKVAQLEGQAGTSVARERGQGFRDAIAQYPDMEVVFEQPTDWSTAQGLSATEDLLVAHPDVVGIWAHADSIIMGAVEALEAEGLNDKVVTVGMGMFAGGPEAIKAGRLDASWELFPAAPRQGRR